MFIKSKSAPKFLPEGFIDPKGAEVMEHLNMDEH